MGIKTTLQDERGEVIEEVPDPTNILHRLLPASDDGEYHFINFIDWYGDTIINRLQMNSFLEEWGRTEIRVFSKEDKKLYSRINELAIRCKNEIHLYLKFMGD